MEASRDAEMICVGSVGIGRYARSILGSAATELAEKAHCPVAVIRTELDQPPPDINWIVVRMTDAPDNDAVVKHAACEAELRRAPCSCSEAGPRNSPSMRDGEFERRVQDWGQRHPELRVYPIATKAAIASFLGANDERVRLAVISGAEAGQLARLIGPTDIHSSATPNARCWSFGTRSGFVVSAVNGNRNPGSGHRSRRSRSVKGHP